MRRGLTLAWPVILGYLPIGLSYGVIARHNGLTTAETVAMSIMVFAGSSQLVAAGMLGAGAGAWAVVVTTFLVNLRHLLFGAALCSRLSQVPRKWLPYLAFGITDEFFAVVTAAPQQNWPVYAWLSLSAYLGWVGSSAAGALLGDVTGPNWSRALEFALTAMFIGLLVPQLTHRSRGLSAGLGAAAVLLLGQVLPAGVSLVLAILLGATAGMMVGK